MVLKSKNNNLFVAQLAKKNNQINTLFNTCYTSCKIYDNIKPIWSISAKKIIWNTENKKIIYYNSFFEVYGIKIFFTPYFFHPAPSAAAQSGILVPKIKNKKLILPLYWRVKSNIDITFTPKIPFQPFSFDLEYRHLLNNGNYIINYYFIRDTKNKVKKYNQYYITSKGKFSQANWKYSFNLKHTSNNVFLKNYMNKYDPYLTSNVKAYKVNKSDFFRVRSLFFQDLRNNEKLNNHIKIFPLIDYQKDINISNNFTCLLYNRIISHTHKAKTINRLNTILSLNKSISFDKNYIDFTIIKRLDIYYLSQRDKIIARSIPELQVKWRYPILNMQSCLIEPQVVFFLRKDKIPHNKIFIDSKSFNLNEHNIYNNNHYSGYDLVEYGKRINYGMNFSSYTINNYYISNFIGITTYLTNPKKLLLTSKNYLLGKLSISKLDTFDFYYRFFSTLNKLNNINSELGVITNLNKKITINSSFAVLNINKNYLKKKYNSQYNNQKLTQLNNSLQYAFIDTFKIKYLTRFDISKKKIMNYGILMTWTKDCVSISVNFNKNFLTDSKRGILKKRTYSIVIRLKTLNM